MTGVENVRREKRGPGVAPDLVQRIEVALSDVSSARLALEAAIDGHAPLDVRRAASAELRYSFDAADACLRKATMVAKERSRHDWTYWRKRLSDLDTRRQIHLIAEMDAEPILRPNSVRAVDTGMSGPAIGDMQHGDSMPPGSPATYGLDVKQILDE